MVIKVDGLKVVIIEPRKTVQEFKDLLNWREYKNRVGLRDTKIASTGGMMGVIIYPPAKTEKGRAA